MKKSSKQLSVLFATAILLANTTVSPLVQAKESSSTGSETSVTTTSGSSSVASTTQSQSSKRASESSASGMSEASGNREGTGKTEAASGEERTDTSKVTQVANIGQIQGESHESPYNGKKVRVANVVVTKTDQYGFYVQDIKGDGNTKTSDAIYVVSQEKVAVGDQLTIEGEVKEGYMEALGLRPGQEFKKPTNSLTVTQLFASKITKNGTATLPEPINISERMPKDIVDNTPTTYDPEHDALDYWESLEGMLTTVKKPRVLGPQYRGDIYLLPAAYQDLPLNNIGGVNLRPNVQNTATIPVYVGNTYVAKAKDYFNEDVVGVVTYRGRIYKLNPTKLPDLQDGGLKREVSKIYPSEDKLTIASYNIENFSANNAAGETPDEKVDKIAKSFINEIHSPDIITLIEVQDNNGSVNDGTVSGVKSGEKLAARIKQLGGKEYKYTEVAPVDGADGGKPGSNIRVAYLYNPQRVKLVEREAGKSTEAAAFKDGHLVKNPARIDPTNPIFTKVRKSLAAEFEFKGEHIVVIANHLKSKLGDDAVYGAKQPAVQNTLAQRIEQGKLLNAFVKEGLKQNPNLKFVLTGDFNDFEFSETAKAVAGNELVNMMLNHDAADRYSYFYRGSNQSLDNIFVSKNIADKTVFSPVHINASFMEEHGRASDHDPVIAQLDFSKKDEPQPTPPSGDSTTPPNKDDKPTKKRILPSTGTTGTEVAVVGLLLFSVTLLFRKKLTK
ncbi:endonuclease/exonuclease/phosphatase family protein [Streptococcus intermedius]|uniref:endonuclease/exonuclease/phosphatase family protein n=1 Tax=Streptococcus intermedius TaxID=1338 RepID=UPI000F68517A|nr:endonuclease/exonuclease/phosphatase family protein [Streptococcus intermedius]RSJ18131.1 Endonuclease/Exonuclease/phosphatase family protein [Streptococcus intermedius]